MSRDNDFLETPSWVYSTLQPFDLDPCAGLNTNIAKENWCQGCGEDGLLKNWGDNFVWCNPPFSQKKLWICKMIQHNHGILLLPERGSAPWFGPLAISAGSYFVMGKRINFIGGTSSNNLGSVLFPFGDLAQQRIMESGLPGHFVNVISFNPRSA